MQTYFRGWFEEHFIYLLILRFTKSHFRYIDKEEFEVFLQKIKNCHPKIKFEYPISKTEINFLDPKVFKVGNQLRTKLYTKPTDKQSCLQIRTTPFYAEQYCI